MYAPVPAALLLCLCTSKSVMERCAMNHNELKDTQGAKRPLMTPLGRPRD